jgi:hypothetical protein
VSAELVSPELALVCPDLRSRAIAALPPPQPWLPKRLHANREQLRHAPPATADRAERTVRAGANVARAAGAYFLARTVDLLVITAGIALFVLVFAAVAGAVRG